MSSLGDLYKYLNWKNKSTEPVEWKECESKLNNDTGMYDYFMWEPKDFLVALRVLGNLRGEGPRFERTLHLWDGSDGLVMAVTKKTISLPRQPSEHSSGSRGGGTEAR